MVEADKNDSITVGGPLLLTDANLLAKASEHDDFAATTVFSDRWKTRHLICMKKILGEEKSVSEDVESWFHSPLPDLYKPEDIDNADETGLFYKLLPDRRG